MKTKKQAQKEQLEGNKSTFPIKRVLGSLVGIILILFLGLIYLGMRTKEITFDNSYLIKNRAPYKITIRKSLGKYEVKFDRLDGEEDFLVISAKDLTYYPQYSDEKKYWYQGRSYDNSLIVKIMTHRPLDDFITNGLSSEEEMNAIQQLDVVSVVLFGHNDFIAGDKKNKNKAKEPSEEKTEQLPVHLTSTLQYTPPVIQRDEEPKNQTYQRRLEKAEEFWSALSWNEVNNSLNAYKYRDIIAEKYHIWFDLSDSESDAYYLTNPKDIIGKYYLAGRSMDNFRYLEKLDLDKWANSNGVSITALDPRTTISPQWYKRHSYEECMGILKYGVESEDADEIGQTLKRRIEDNIYRPNEIIEAIERFQNQGYLSKVTNREIKEFFEKELRKY